MSIKMIAFDVDGTVVKDDHLTLPKNVVEAFNKAHDMGIKIVMSTGRTVKLSREEIDTIGCVDYLVMSNGAIITDNNGNVLNSKYISNDEAAQICKIFKEHNALFQVYADQKGYEDMFTYNHELEVKGLPEKFLLNYRERMENVEDIMEVIFDINVEKINVDQLPEEYYEEVMDQLGEIPDLFITGAYKGNMEVVKKGTDKGNGLKWLADSLGIDASEVMAFGDSGNDVTMLKWAGESYALINGSDSAKEAAKYQTKIDNNEGGVGLVILEYLDSIN